MIKKRVVKSCCGGKSWLYETENPVNKIHLEEFLTHGFSTSPHFMKSGIFYIQKKTLIASCSFGTRKVTVRSSGQELVLTEFEQLLETIVNA